MNVLISERAPCLNLERKAQNLIPSANSVETLLLKRSKKTSSRFEIPIKKICKVSLLNTNDETYMF